ncbi:hypothetical protein C7T94_02570 [Pedobacter yulinensis]|uniref:Uncharacterized protein n=1 Tax=Pedobacter yulinensis TaxID=2126353 RepID=A0A2T3HRF1_9SPHI|nr:hypothetical protein [Pedobacter yulinensis]PST85018.1 hypothetical protein C7T94_02570 [Pedobacter yulinensis]
MKTQGPAARGKLKILQVIHTSFCAAVLLFAIVALSAQRQTYFSINMAEGGQFFLVFPVLVLVTLFAGMRLFTFMLKDVELLPSAERLTRYMGAFLVQMALFEAAGLANTVLFLKTGNYLFLAFAGVALLAMLSVRPTRTRIANLLKLQPTDTDLL